jgi:hypothetical protein
MVRLQLLIPLLFSLAVAAQLTGQTKSKPGPVDVLQDLSAAIALPELTIDGQPNPKALQPLTLGKLALPAGSTVLVTLHGGEEIPKARTQAFQLETVGDELTARAWDIWLKTGKPNERVKIATLALANGSLQLQWTAEAASEPNAAYLCNCVLQVLAGKSEKLIALRQPAKGEPLALSLKEATVQRWDLARPPDASRLKVELGLKGIGRYKLNGNSTLKADGDETTIEFIERNLGGLVRIRIECDLKRQLEIKATPLLALPGQKPTRLDEAALKKAEENLQAAVKQLELQSQALSKRGKAAAAARTQVDRRLDGAKATLGRIQATRDFIAAFPQSFKAPVRVFFELDKKLVDVLKTGK